MSAIADRESTNCRTEFLSISTRAETLLHQYHGESCRQTDRLFCLLMVTQWMLGVFVAIWITPYTWISAQYQLHIHLLAAIFLGCLIASLPIVLAILKPGQVTTRHVMAIGQVLFGAMFIHLTGGRIETHFHIFGSLAFLSIYGDWRVLVTASKCIQAGCNDYATKPINKNELIATCIKWQIARHAFALVPVE